MKALLIAAAIIISSQAWSEGLTRKEIEIEIRDHQSDMRTYILNKFEALLKLSATESKSANLGLNAFLSVLEDLSVKQLKVAQHTLDLLELTQPLPSLYQGYPEISEFITQYDEGTFSFDAPHFVPFVDALFKFKKFATEKISRKPVQTSTMTLSEFAKLKNMDIVKGFERLKVEDLMQSFDGAACVLYSFLWAIKQTPSLNAAFKESVLSKIREDEQGDYYWLENNKVRKISRIELADLKSDLHPSNDSVLRLIGLYTIAKMGLIKTESYHLSNPATGRDYFFDKETRTVGRSFLTQSVAARIKDFELKPGMTLLKDDGTIETRSDNEISKYSGNFVISVGIQNHAMALFYDSTQKKWKLFDNLRGRGLKNMDMGGIADKVNWAQLIGDAVPVGR